MTTINLRNVVGALLMVTFYAGQAPAEAAELGDFNARLASEYQALAAVEAVQGDRRDAADYTAKAAAAAAGNPTEPARVESRQPYLKMHYVQPIVSARDRLVAAFEKSGRAKAPAAAARAQSSYDCWLEQAAEDLQTEHIMACEQAYVAAIGEVEAALAVKVAVVEVDPDTDGDGVPDSRDDCPGTPQGTAVDMHGCPEIPNLEGVHFEFGKSSLTAEARSILEQAAAIVERNPHVRVEAVGHTDSVGSDEYNQRLSQQRADAARDFLVQQGVASSRTSASGMGESSPVADNGSRDGRRMNQRVQLTARPN
jgi:outer membrane protein OmpA-like peptidoglycan-associated protein